MILLFVLTVLLLFFSVPTDKNSYLCEYNDKIDLLKNTEQPRIILLGGSSVAFGTNSKMISDSLNVNCINMGLHGGIGIRYPMEDFYDYIKHGDIVVLQIEYANFFNGGNGEKETFPFLMMSTGWRNWRKLNTTQWENIVKGLPYASISNLLRVFSAIRNGGFDSIQNKESFNYLKSGFNEVGDEVSHFQYENLKTNLSTIPNKYIDKEFVIWLKNMLLKYDSAGATVIMLPPVIAYTHFAGAYNERISEVLNDIQHPYIVNPEFMVVPDKFSFNSGYHVDERGATINTLKIIEIIKSVLPQM